MSSVYCVDVPGARLGSVHGGPVIPELLQDFPPLAWLSQKSWLILPSCKRQASQSISNVCGPHVWATELRPSWPQLVVVANGKLERIWGAGLVE